MPEDYELGSKGGPVCPRSRLSPRQSKSSMFFVMILVTSFRFSLS